MEGNEMVDGDADEKDREEPRRWRDRHTDGRDGQGRRSIHVSDVGLTLYSPAQHPTAPPSYPARHAAISATRLPAGPQDSALLTPRGSARACRSSSCSRPYGPTVPVTSGC